MQFLYYTLNFLNFLFTCMYKEYKHFSLSSVNGCRDGSAKNHKGPSRIFNYGGGVLFAKIWTPMGDFK